LGQDVKEKRDLLARKAVKKILSNPHCYSWGGHIHWLLTKFYQQPNGYEPFFKKDKHTYLQITLYIQQELKSLWKVWFYWKKERFLLAFRGIYLKQILLAKFRSGNKRGLCKMGCPKCDHLTLWGYFYPRIKIERCFDTHEKLYQSHSKSENA